MHRPAKDLNSATLHSRLFIVRRSQNFIFTAEKSPDGNAVLVHPSYDQNRCKCFAFRADIPNYHHILYFDKDFGFRQLLWGPQLTDAFMSKTCRCGSLRYFTSKRTKEKERNRNLTIFHYVGKSLMNKANSEVSRYEFANYYRKKSREIRHHQLTSCNKGDNFFSQISIGEL